MSFCESRAPQPYKETFVSVSPREKGVGEWERETHTHRERERETQREAWMEWMEKIFMYTDPKVFKSGKEKAFNRLVLILANHDWTRHIRIMSFKSMKQICRALLYSTFLCYCLHIDGELKPYLTVVCFAGSVKYRPKYCGRCSRANVEGGKDGHRHSHKTVIVWHIHMPPYQEESGREHLCMLHECWAWAQGVDCVRQAIVIWYQKVGIRAIGHKMHTHRGSAGQRRTHTQTWPHIQFNFNRTCHKNRKVGWAEIRESPGQILKQVRLLWYKLADVNQKEDAGEVLQQRK